MSFYEVGTIKNYLANCKKKYPEMWEAYSALTSRERNIIVMEIKSICDKVSNIGPLGAFELLYKLGRFYYVRDGNAVCPTCGRSINAH